MTLIEIFRGDLSTLGRIERIWHMERSVEYHPHISSESFLDFPTPRMNDERNFHEKYERVKILFIFSLSSVHHHTINCSQKDVTCLMNHVQNIICEKSNKHIGNVLFSLLESLTNRKENKVEALLTYLWLFLGSHFPKLIFQCVYLEMCGGEE